MAGAAQDRPALPTAQELLAPAAALCAQAGQAAPVELTQLAGGKNNRVFRADLDGGGRLVLKSYFRHARDPRDRLGAEWAFASFAWVRGVRTVPQPLACNRGAQLALYGFLDGRKLAADEITADHVTAAARFICEVNRVGGPGTALAPGSEACFTLADHLARVDSRLDRLADLDPSAPHVGAARAFVDDRLRPEWTALKARILADQQAAGADPDRPIPEAEIIASPSDFGFHNAILRPDGSLGFIDFEYAGRDDPAKLAGDFFNCPEIPTPAQHFDLFADGLCDGLGLGGAARDRVGALRPVYGFKWACIVLNDFIAHHDARRQFADQGNRATRCAAQLGKAERLIFGA